MRAALCWADRDRAAKALGEVPLPVANAYIKANTNDIELGRSLARARYTVHDDYLRAIIVYGMEPVRNFEHPSGTIKLNHYILPDGMRQSDKHWETIASADVPLKNEIRRNQPESLLKGVKKTPESVNEWL